MLQSSLNDHSIPEDFNLEGVVNYYEHLVYTGLANFRDELSADQIADATCLALNRLPAWYIRHNVDAHFFLHDDQIADMNRNVSQALDFAIAKVKDDPR